MSQSPPTLAHLADTLAAGGLEAFQASTFLLAGILGAGLVQISLRDPDGSEVAFVSNHPDPAYRHPLFGGARQADPRIIPFLEGNEGTGILLTDPPPQSLAALTEARPLLLLAARSLIREETLRSRAEHAERLHTSLLELVDKVSHDIRSPLTVILARAELLQFAHNISAEAREANLLLIQRQVADLRRINDATLHLAREEAGKLAFTLGPVNLQEETERVATIWERPNHKIRLDFPEGLPPARAASDRLRDTLEQLVANAVSYSPDGSEIEVSGRQAGNRIVLEVADRGDGIPEEEAEEVFKRFFRLHRDRLRNIRGSGLGLAVARALAEGMGGTLTHHPRPGGGTIFSLTLPLAEA